MIHHIVLWRLKPELTAVARADLLERVRHCMEALRAVIPGLHRLDLGVNQAQGPDAADLVLYSEFADWEALRAYDVHPLHEQLKGLIGPVRTERRVVDYQS